LFLSINYYYYLDYRLWSIEISLYRWYGSTKWRN
jgi:hypothetical protein